MTSHCGRALALACTIVVAALQGCASGQPPEAFGKAGANTGTVYVSRPSQLAAVGMAMNVYVDGAQVGSISNGQCIRLTLPAGRHAIKGRDAWPTLFDSGHGTVHVDVRPGSASYVVITPTMMMPGQYLIYPASIVPSGQRC
jgi:hypothetical protein